MRLFNRLSTRQATNRRGLQGWQATIALVALTLLPSTALSAPVTYSFESGSAAIRGTLGGGGSAFSPAGSIIVNLTAATAVVDSGIGSFGSLESLSVVLEDFSANLNPLLTGMSSISVSSATLSSLGAAALSEFGQFSTTSSISASVSGTSASGPSYGPATVTSLAGTGTTTGVLALSGDTLMLRISGVSLASFAPFAPEASNAQVEVDFSFVGRATPATPIPEPSAALVFALGMTLAGSALRRRH
jgi:hypothetical protein